MPRPDTRQHERAGALAGARVAQPQSLRVMLAGWENGYRQPSELYQRLLCQVYGRSGTELGFSTQPHQAEAGLVLDEVETRGGGAPASATSARPPAATAGRIDPVARGSSGHPAAGEIAQSRQPLRRSGPRPVLGQSTRELSDTTGHHRIGQDRPLAPKPQVKRRILLVSRGAPYGTLSNPSPEVRRPYPQAVVAFDLGESVGKDTPPCALC